MRATGFSVITFLCYCSLKKIKIVFGSLRKGQQGKGRKEINLRVHLLSGKLSEGQNLTAV